MPPRIVDVLVPVELDQAYSYRVPPGVELQPGDLVSVSLGPRETMGVAWGDGTGPPAARARGTTTGCAPSGRSPCTRRLSRSCDASSIGSRTTRWGRAAWCCA